MLNLTHETNQEVVAIPDAVAQVDTPSELPQELDDLLAALERDAKKRQRWNIWVTRAYVISTLVLYGTWLVDWLITGGVHHIGNYINYLAIIFLCNLFGWGLGAFFLNRRAVSRLAKLDDLRAIGPLIDVLVNQGTLNYSRRTKKMAQAALVRLLPRLQASDAHLLPEPQRAILRNFLFNGGYIAFGSYHDSAFLLAILKAFEQVGDWRCVPMVESAAHSTKDMRVHNAARACLPYLRSIAAKRSVGETLLRPSSSSDVSTSDSLLRPASGSSEQQPQQLLRASMTDEA